MRTLPLLLAFLTACGSPESVQWLEGVGFEWDRFNHRISYAEFHLLDDDVDVVFVGGTSTTGVRGELTAECDPDETPTALGCEEFSTTDVALVNFGAGRAESARITSATGSLALVADADGTSGTLTLELPRRPKGDVIALIHGLVLDTDEPLSGGPSCYRPEFGWHPRRIAVLLGEPTVDGTTVTVPVEVVFEAGNSLEDERQCVDAVHTEARVAMRVGIQVIAAGGEAVHTTVEQSQTFAYGVASNLEEQLPPDLSERTIDLDFDGPIGWSAVDYRFHADDPEDRGAYLRSLSFQLHADIGAASGEARNYSIGTQLSGFDYDFTGTVSGLPVGLDVERRRAVDEVEIETTEDGYETVRLALEPPP